MRSVSERSRKIIGLDANLAEKITDFVTRFVPDRRRRRNASLPANDDEAAEDEDESEDDLDEDMDSLDVDDEPRSKAKYMRIMRKVANRQTAKVVVDLADLQQFSNDRSLLHNILNNTRRYVQLFADVLDKLKPAPDHEADHADDVLDLIMEQRARWNQSQEDQGIPGDTSAQFPPELMRRL